MKRGKCICKERQTHLRVETNTFACEDKCGCQNACLLDLASERYCCIHVDWILLHHFYFQFVACSFLYFYEHEYVRNYVHAETNCDQEIASLYV